MLNVLLIVDADGTGAVTGAVTTPLDVIKTRLMTQAYLVILTCV